MPREARLARTLVELSDSLSDNFDVEALLTLLADRCVELIGASAAGIMLVAEDGDVALMASSSDTMRRLELFELECGEGPCIDCLRSGEAIVNQDLRTCTDRWPRIVVACIDAGFHTVHAVPMRLRGTTVGALNLFQSTPEPLGPNDLAAAQAFADVATIAILQHRSADASGILIGELRQALASRIVIEQAKGVLAARADTDVETAFGLMRHYARTHNVRLTDVARQVIHGDLGPDTLRVP
jgi:GAF domain-containing protein